MVPISDKLTERSLPQAGNVDVWMLSLRGWDIDNKFLSAEEHERARRFHFDRDRNRFTGCRSWLRMVLGEYLGLDPATVRFEYGQQGKPSVARDQNAIRLQFNLAHSGDFGLLAVAIGRRVGVDLEQIDRLRDQIQIAERYFSPREAQDLRALPVALQREGFAACWTRKEAFIKALGLGLSLPLSAFSVAVNPHELPTLHELPADQQDMGWWVQDLPAPDGYRAALVTEGGACVVRDRASSKTSRQRQES